MMRSKGKIRCMVMGCLIMVILLSVTGCGSSESTYRWPDSAIAKYLPVPESQNGEIEEDAEDSFMITIFDTTKEQYLDYVEACKENGFTVDYYSTDNMFMAENEDGCSLSIDYDESKKAMSIDIYTLTEIPEPDENVSPEFKEMLDSYEAFFDEYIEFMEKYEKSDNTADMLEDYSDYLEKYTDYMQKLNDVNQEELSVADAAYYMEVQSRITKKLAKIAG